MSLKAAIKKIWMYANRLPYALHNFTFQPIDESIAFWDITSRYKIGMITGAHTDVVIVGAGFAGLSCAYEVSKNANVQINIIDPCFCAGEGAWLGDSRLYAVVVPKPAHSFLDELGIPYDEKDKYVVVQHAALFISTILSKLLAMPNVKLFNTMAVKDLIVEEGRVGGVVATRTLSPMKHDDIELDMEPIVMEAKVVVCSYSLNRPFRATAAGKLKSIGMIYTVPKMKSPPDMNAVEDVIVRLTREIVPGLIVTGTGAELAEIDGAPRMGLQFWSMIAGLKAAHLALKSLGLRN